MTNTHNPQNDIEAKVGNIMAVLPLTLSSEEYRDIQVTTRQAITEQATQQAAKMREMADALLYEAQRGWDAPGEENMEAIVARYLPPQPKD